MGSYCIPDLCTQLPCYHPLHYMPSANQGLLVQGITDHEAQIQPLTLENMLLISWRQK